MEVWLESLSMHLSVCMPIPSDLLFDIYHYRGLSPSSSGSTTPEGIASECRSPNLSPIKEGKMQQNTDITDSSLRRNVSNDNLKAQDTKPDVEKSKKNSLENLQDTSKLYSTDVDKSVVMLNKPNDVRINDFSRTELGSDKIDNKSNSIDIPLSKINRSNDIRYSDISVSKIINMADVHNKNGEELSKPTTNSLVALRKVPKHFTRNRFRHCQEVPEFSRLSKLNVIPKFTSRNQFEVNKSSNDIAQNNSDSIEGKLSPHSSDGSLVTDIPDIVSSCTIKKSPNKTQIVTSPPTPTKIKYTTNLANASQVSCSELPTSQTKKFTETTLGSSGNKKFSDPSFQLSKPSASNSKTSSIVKNIVDTLNRNDKTKSDGGMYVRHRHRNVEVKSKTNEPKAPSKIRSCSPVESTAL